MSVFRQETPEAAVAAFSDSYAEARRRFREAARHLDWQLESYAMTHAGPSGEELALDVACSPVDNVDPRRVVVVSSGVHGVEGFLGSAVQLAWLKYCAAQRSQPPVRFVFLHGLNPFGFAWFERVNEQNVDLNRNFLCEGEPFTGAADGYAQLDDLLNPRSRYVGRDLFFHWQALMAILRDGMPALRQAVAGGQYTCPQGLFFGGAGRSWTHDVLAAHFGRWLAGVHRVIHLDIHSGLGRWANCKLLLDHELSVQQHAMMTKCFGAGSFERSSANGIAYQACGGLGKWCMTHNFADDYLFAYAEFGTYGPLRMLAGLRAANQIRHWGGTPGARHRNRSQLCELFCPKSPRWRSAVLAQGLKLIHRACQDLSES